MLTKYDITEADSGPEAKKQKRHRDDMEDDDMDVDQGGGDPKFNTLWEALAALVSQDVPPKRRNTRIVNRNNATRETHLILQFITV